MSTATKRATTITPGHDHAGHDEMNSLELSKQAQANVGLKLGKVALSTFERTISIPGILRERPGRSTVAITTPLTGIVTRIYVIQGEAVEAGQKLFDLQLTHEELVQGQGDFLRRRRNSTSSIAKSSGWKRSRSTAASRDGRCSNGSTNNKRSRPCFARSIRPCCCTA